MKDKYSWEGIRLGDSATGESSINVFSSFETGDRIVCLCWTWMLRDLALWKRSSDAVCSDLIAIHNVLPCHRIFLWAVQNNACFPLISSASGVGEWLCFCLVRSIDLPCYCCLCAWRAVFSCANLAVTKSAKCRPVHCSISFVFVNFCPNIG
jgi:hypothetical protein